MNVVFTLIICLPFILMAAAVISVAVRQSRLKEQNRVLAYQLADTVQQYAQLQARQLSLLDNFDAMSAICERSQTQCRELLQQNENMRQVASNMLDASASERLDRRDA